MTSKIGDIKDRNLLISMILNFIITAIEVIGGFLAGSLSLISDALHNFGDGVSVASSYAAVKISKKRTYREDDICI